MSDEKDRSFARGIAHHFNNALHGILGNLQLVMKHELPEEAAESVRVADKSATRLAALVRQMLDFMKAGDIAPREFPISGVGRLMEDEFKSLAGRIQLIIDLPAVVFTGDADKIVLMLRLLVQRSVESLEGRENGRIVVSAFPTRKEVSGKRRDFLVFSVTDNGPAIHENMLGHVFEPFFNPTEPNIPGDLKLATVSAIAAAHGGWAECNSGNAGAMFSVYLPAAKQEPATSENHIG